MFNSDKPVSAKNLEDYFKEDFKKQAHYQKPSAIKTTNSAPSSASENDSKITRKTENLSLQTADENSNLEHITIRWHGKLVNRLGLGEEVTKNHFKKICEGKHPLSGEELIKSVKPREKTDHKGRQGKTLSRRAGMPQTISAPKSVSLLVPYDKRVIAAHQRAVIKALDTVEQFTRVKMGNTKSPEKTGEHIRVLFTHFDARPDSKTGFASLDLHTHCPPLNLGFDGQGKPRAIEFRETLRSQKLGTAVYRAELVKEMETLGYIMKINEKTRAPEVAGISREYIEATSTRHREIVDRAKELGIKSTKAVAVSYRQSKKIDREATTIRRAELEEQFGFEALRAAENALAKTKNLDLHQSVSSDKLKEKENTKAQKTVESVDFVLTKTTEQQNNSPKKQWVCRQNLIAEAILHARYELTIDDIQPEFQKRSDRGELDIFNLEKYGTGKEIRKNHDTNSLHLKTNTEITNNQSEQYVESTTAETKRDSFKSAGTKPAFAGERESGKFTGTDAAHPDDPETCYRADEQHGKNRSSGNQTRDRHRDEFGENSSEREYKTETIKFSDGAANSNKSVSEGTGQIDSDALSGFSSRTTDIMFTTENSGGKLGAENPVNSGRNTITEKRDSELDRGKGISGLGDRSTDRSKSSVFNDANRKSGDSENDSAGDQTNSEWSETVERKSTADFNSNGAKRTENTGIGRGFSHSEGISAAQPELAAPNKTIAAQSTENNSDGQSNPEKTNGFNDSFSSEYQTEKSGQNLYTTNTVSNEPQNGSGLGNATIKFPKNIDGKSVSVENIENLSDDQFETGSERISGKISTGDDQREKSAELEIKSENILIRGRNDSGGVGKIHSESDQSTIRLRDRGDRISRSENSLDSGSQTESKQTSTISKKSETDIWNSSRTKYGLVVSNDHGSSFQRLGNNDQVDQSGVLDNGNVDDHQYNCDHSKFSGGTSNKTEPNETNRELDKIQSFNAGDSSIFNDSSVRHHFSRHMDVTIGDMGIHNPDADYSADDFNSNCNDRNEFRIKQLSFENRQEILDSYRRKFADQLNEILKSQEDDRQANKNVIDLFPTANNSFVSQTDMGQTQSDTQSINDFSRQAFQETSDQQKLNQSLINQQIAEQYEQTQISQTQFAFYNEQEENNQNYYQFDKVRQNFTTHSSSSYTGEKDDLWRNDRIQREAQIAKKINEMRSEMTDSERLAYDNAEFEEAEEFEHKQNEDVKMNLTMKM